MCLSLCVCCMCVLFVCEFMCVYVYMYVCMNYMCSLQRYSEVDCTIYDKEYNLSFGETDAEVTKKLAV